MDTQRLASTHLRPSRGAIRFRVADARERSRVATAAWHVEGKHAAHARDWRRAGMWILQGASAAAFIVAGGAIVWSPSQPVRPFDAVDQAVTIGPWLRFAIAVLEIVGGVALLDIDAAGFAAVALSALTLGSVVAALILQTTPSLPAAMSTATLLIAWARRDDLLGLVRQRDNSSEGR